MTQEEFMNKVEEIRKSSLELAAKIGMGGGASYPTPELKYPSVPNLHYNDEQQKSRKETGRFSEECSRELPIFAHYEVLHSCLLTLVISYGAPNWATLPMLCKMSVKKLQELLLYNCSYEYQQVARETKEVKTDENNQITI